MLQDKLSEAEDKQKGRKLSASEIYEIAEDHSATFDIQEHGKDMLSAYDEFVEEMDGYHTSNV